MDEPKIIAGLHCFEVLEHLDDYVSEVLPADLVARVNEHLAGCGACASFGGRYAELVRVLRAEIAGAAPPEDARAFATKLLSMRGDEH